MALSNETDKRPIAVVKVGGEVLLEENEREGLARNIYELHQMGWGIIILHGGGAQVNELQALYDLPSNIIAGRRITSKADLLVIKQAIAGEVNVDLVALLIKQGLAAFGCHGASGMLIEAKRRPPIKVTGENGKSIDFGEVGDVISINHPLLKGLLALGQIPVIATLGISQKGRVFNINADTTAVAIAKAVDAELLLLISNIGGIYRNLLDPNSLITELNPKDARTLIEKGIIKDGMIPKVQAAIDLLDQSKIKTIAITAASRRGVFKSLASKRSFSDGIEATVLKRN